jgi:hypothetical protein
MSRYIVKAMYFEKLKRLIIWNRECHLSCHAIQNRKKEHDLTLLKYFLFEKRHFCILEATFCSTVKRYNFRKRDSTEIFGFVPQNARPDTWGIYKHM